MSETTLNKSLSGAELRAAICYHINRALEQDDRFAAHKAFSAFSFTAHVQVRVPKATIEMFSRSISGSEGDPLTEENSEVLDVPIDSAPEPEAPNVVRIESEQPLPVLASDGKGGTEEKWKKVGKGYHKSKNVVVGG